MPPRRAQPPGWPPNWFGPVTGAFPSFRIWMLRAWSSAELSASHRDEPAIRMVALGDSTLTGPGLETPEEIWLRRAVRDLNLNRSVEVRSLAAGGSRARDVAAHVDEALATKPDVAVVAVGSNDLIRGVPSRLIAKELGRLADALLETVPVVAVASIGDLGSIPRFRSPLSEVLRTRSRLASGAIAAMVSRRRGAVLIDVAPANAAFRGSGAFCADYFHPNTTGHALWGLAALPGLREAFGRLGVIE